jgi:hypothetical protein
LRRRKIERKRAAESLFRCPSEVALKEPSRLGLDEDARDERESPDDLLARLSNLVAHVQVGDTDQSQGVSSVSGVGTHTRGKCSTHPRDESVRKSRSRELLPEDKAAKG